VSIQRRQANRLLYCFVSSTHQVCMRALMSAENHMNRRRIENWVRKLDVLVGPTWDHCWLQVHG